MVRESPSSRQAMNQDTRPKQRREGRHSSKAGTKHGAIILDKFSRLPSVRVPRCARYLLRSPFMCWDVVDFSELGLFMLSAIGSLPDRRETIIITFATTVTQWSHATRGHAPCVQRCHITRLTELLEV